MGLLSIMPPILPIVVTVTARGNDLSVQGIGFKGLQWSLSGLEFRVCRYHCKEWQYQREATQAN